VNAKLYSKVAGVVLLLVGVMGFFMNPLMGMDLSKRHSVVHLVSGALLAYLGFTDADASLTKNLVLLFGVVYTILGVWGFFTPMMFPFFRIYFTDALINCIHLVIGLAGLAAAMLGGAKAAPAKA